MSHKLWGLFWYPFADVTSRLHLASGTTCPVHHDIRRAPTFFGLVRWKWMNDADPWFISLIRFDCIWDPSCLNVHYHLSVKKTECAYSGAVPCRPNKKNSTVKTDQNQLNKKSTHQESIHQNVNFTTFELNKSQLNKWPIQQMPIHQSVNSTSQQKSPE